MEDVDSKDSDLSDEFDGYVNDEAPRCLDEEMEVEGVGWEEPYMGGEGGALEEPFVGKEEGRALEEESLVEEPLVGGEEGGALESMEEGTHAPSITNT